MGGEETTTTEITMPESAMTHPGKPERTGAASAIDVVFETPDLVVAILEKAALDPWRLCGLGTLSKTLYEATHTDLAQARCPMTLTASVGFTGLPSVEVAKFGFHGARTKLGIVPTMLSQAIVNSLLMREGGPAARQQRLRLRAKGRHVPFHARRPGWALDDSAWTRSTRMTAPRHRQGGWWSRRTGMRGMVT